MNKIETLEIAIDAIKDKKDSCNEVLYNPFDAIDYVQPTKKRNRKYFKLD